MRKILFLLAVFVFAGGFAMAGPIEWGGSFTFRLGANPENLLFDHTVPADFADVSALYLRWRSAHSSSLP